MMVRIESSGATHVGRVRDNNEDSFLVDDGINLFVVADGMGGHAAGEVASQTATETIRSFIIKTRYDQRPSWPFPTPREYPLTWQKLMASVMMANGAIYRQSRKQSELAGMGTTVVAVLLNSREAVYAHVGDSRIYLKRGGALTQLTEDHSWIQEQINAKRLTEEEAANHPLRNVITRALGGSPSISVDINSLTMEPGDTILLCSDGLTTMLGDEEIHAILSQESDLSVTVDALIEGANRRGGYDNTTVVLIRILSV